MRKLAYLRENYRNPLSILTTLQMDDHCIDKRFNVAMLSFMCTHRFLPISVTCFVEFG